MALVNKTISDLVTVTRASVGGYCNADREFVLAAANEARLDHSPASGDRLGLLVEAQSENLLNFTDDLTRGNAATLNTTVAKNISVTPENDADNALADLLEATDTGGTAEVYLDRAFALTSHPCCVSVFAKAADSDYIRIGLHQSDGTLIGEAIFDLATPAVVSSTGVSSAGVEAWGNSWVRCYIIDTTARTGDFLARFGLAAADGLSKNVDTTAATGAFLWGLDVQPESFLLTHIPSTGTAFSTPSYYYYFDHGLSSPLQNLKAVTAGVPTDEIYYREKIIDYDPEVNLDNDVEPVGGPLANKLRFSEILTVGSGGATTDLDIGSGDFLLTFDASVARPDSGNGAWIVGDTAPNPTQDPASTILPRKQFTALNWLGETDTGSGFSHVSVYVKQATSPCAIVEFTSFTTTRLIIDFTAADPTIVNAYISASGGAGAWSPGDGSFIYGARSGTYGGLGLDPRDTDMYKITDAGNGWYRVQMIAEDNIAVTDFINVGPCDGVYYSLFRSWDQVIGDGSSGVYVTGAQVRTLANDGSTALDIIEQTYSKVPRLVEVPAEATASDPTTREADLVSFIDTGWLNDDTEYTIAVKSVLKAVGSSEPRLFDYYQSADPLQFVSAEYADPDVVASRANSSGALSDIGTTIALTAGDTFNVAVRSSALAVNYTWLLSVNDESLVSGDLAVAPVCDTLEAGDSAFYGWIAKVTYYPCAAEESDVSDETATGA